MTRLKPGRCWRDCTQGVPVIPGPRSRKIPINHDRERTIVKRGIGWFKQCRRLATRFEKTASILLGTRDVRHRSPLAAKSLYR